LSGAFVLFLRSSQHAEAGSQRPAQRLRGQLYGSAEAPSRRRFRAVLRGEQEHRQGWSPVCFSSVL